MSIRRMMLFTLIGNLFKDIIASFKNRVINDSGTFEAENDLNTKLNLIGKDLFDSASLVITPNGVKTSKLYTIKPNDGTGDLSVTRATTATRIDENGNIVDVPANVARIDYSNGKPCFLIEPQRTNLVFPSATATTQTRAVTARAYTLSFYGTGSVTLSGAFSGSLVGTGANNRVSLTFTPTAGDLTLTVSGSVINWQLEAGSNATSLIPTTNSAVTRNADVISKTGATNLIGQTEGTIFLDFNRTNVVEGFKALLIMYSDYLTNTLNVQTGNNIATSIFVAWIVNGVSYQKTVPLVAGRNKLMLIYDANSTKVFINGTQLTPSLANVGLPPMNNIYLNNRISSRQYGEMHTFALWKYKLTDSQAITLTTL